MKVELVLSVQQRPPAPAWDKKKKVLKGLEKYWKIQFGK
ncbi:hypothetical protein UFO1_1673 [Pelosinus sp. UFO1]|nr:hypothetical protein UFO1_1673 [Pelosinus sp. UFO1]